MVQRDPLVAEIGILLTTTIMPIIKPIITPTIWKGLLIGLIIADTIILGATTEPQDQEIPTDLLYQTSAIASNSKGILSK